MQSQKLSVSQTKQKGPSHKTVSADELSDLEIASLFLETIPLTMQSIRNEMRQARTTELTLPQFRILANLWCEPANNRMLADNLGLSVAATSRMVDWLIKHGLAERAQAKTDRRQVLVQLTPLGKKTFEFNQKQTRLGFEKKIKNLSSQTKQNLARGLLALKNAVSLMTHV